MKKTAEQLKEVAYQQLELDNSKNKVSLGLAQYLSYIKSQVNLTEGNNWRIDGLSKFNRKAMTKMLNDTNIIKKRKENRRLELMTGVGCMEPIIYSRTGKLGIRVGTICEIERVDETIVKISIYDSEQTQQGQTIQITSEWELVNGKVKHHYVAYTDLKNKQKSDIQPSQDKTIYYNMKEIPVYVGYANELGQSDIALHGTADILKEIERISNMLHEEVEYNKMQYVYNQLFNQQKPEEFHNNIVEGKRIHEVNSPDGNLTSGLQQLASNVNTTLVLQQTITFLTQQFKRNQLSPMELDETGTNKHNLEAIGKNLDVIDDLNAQVKFRGYYLTKWFQALVQWLTLKEVALLEAQEIDEIKVMPQISKLYKAQEKMVLGMAKQAEATATGAKPQEQEKKPNE